MIDLGFKNLQTKTLTHLLVNIGLEKARRIHLLSDIDDIWLPKQINEAHEIISKGKDYNLIFQIL